MQNGDETLQPRVFITLEQFTYIIFTCARQIKFARLCHWIMINLRSGHRPVIVKRALIGSKGGLKLSTIFLSCNVYHDWSIIKIWKYIVFIRWVYLCCTF